MTKTMTIQPPPSDAPKPIRRGFPSRRRSDLLYIGYWTGLTRPKPQPRNGRVRTFPEPPPYDVQVEEWEQEMAYINSLPDPRDFVDETWTGPERDAVIAHLGEAEVFVRWRGVSFCRFDCGVDRMGSRCMTDGVYVWPEGFLHYINKHAVKPDQDFIDHVLARR